MTARRVRGIRALRVVGSVVVLFVALAIATANGVVGRVSVTGSPAAEPVPSGVATSSPSSPREQGLPIAAVTAADRTQLGVAVLDRFTGELAVGARGSETFLTASLSKIVIAVDIIDRRRHDGLAVSENDLELLRRALGPSDDGAMNVLWTRFDGPGAAARVSQRAGLTNTRAPRDHSQWGEMSTTAADLTQLWRYVLDDMPPEDAEFIIDAIAAAPPIARDGFDQRFGLLASEITGPGGPGAIAKQGWMCCFSGQYYLHSVGAVGPNHRFLVTVLARLPRSGWAAARTELTTIARAAVRDLGLAAH